MPVSYYVRESFDLIPQMCVCHKVTVYHSEWINKEKMDIPFVIMTEYASVTDAVRQSRWGQRTILLPVFHEQLADMVKELLKPVSTVRSKEKELFKRTSPKAMEAAEYGGVGCSIGYFSIDSRGKWYG